jgi:hypothetical protein
LLKKSQILTKIFFWNFFGRAGTGPEIWAEPELIRPKVRMNSGTCMGKKKKEEGRGRESRPGGG